jgi:hypothetical protein
MCDVSKIVGMASEADNRKQSLFRARHSDRRGTLAVPTPGERIRLTDRQRIHTLDYASSGEQHRLVSPLANGRSLSHGDETMLWLVSGAVVEVAEVQVVWTPATGIVVARVVPTNENDGGL